MQNKFFNFNFLNSYKLLWTLLLIVILCSLTAVLIPIFVIQPFKAQTTELLNLSYSLRSWSVTITLLALVVGLVLQCLLWYKTQRWLGKLLIIFILFPLLATSWFARQNHFEWMFAPLPNANYVKIEQANFIADKDMVMAVELNGEAVAYPVKQLAYHHIAQDTVGGTAIVVTY